MSELPPPTAPAERPPTGATPPSLTSTWPSATAPAVAAHDVHATPVIAAVPASVPLHVRLRVPIESVAMLIGGVLVIVAAAVACLALGRLVVAAVIGLLAAVAAVGVAFALAQNAELRALRLTPNVDRGIGMYLAVAGVVLVIGCAGTIVARQR